MTMKQFLTILIGIALVAGVLSTAPSANAEAPEAGSAGLLAFHQPKVDTRADQLRSFLASFDSPLTDSADHFVAEADRLGLDWKLVAAIAGIESTFGKHIPYNSYNGWGWGVFTGQQDGIHFKNWGDGITKVSEGLRYNYIDKGARSIEQIGRIYAASPAWSWKVRFFLNKIEAFAPTRPNQLDITI